MTNIQTLFDRPAADMTLEQIAEFFSLVHQKAKDLMPVFDRDPSQIWDKLEAVKSTSFDASHEARLLLDEELAILRPDIEEACA